MFVESRAVLIRHMQRNLPGLERRVTKERNNILFMQSAHFAKTHLDVNNYRIRKFYILKSSSDATE